MRDEVLQEARKAYARGWAPIPLRFSEKAPDLPRNHGLLERRATPQELRDFNWGGLGIVTGELSGIVVLDVDDDAGGSTTLADRGWDKFVGPYVWTPGGWHFYFQYDERLDKTLIGTLGPGLDLKSNGGYVVAPPSLHPSGQRYEWVVTPEELPLPEAPYWVFGEGPEGRSLTHEAGPENERIFDDLISEGNRNETMARLAGILHWDRLPMAWCATALLAINEEHFDPPLPEDEVMRVAQNILSRPQRGV